MMVMICIDIHEFLTTIFWKSYVDWMADKNKLSLSQATTYLCLKSNKTKY